MVNVLQVLCHLTIQYRLDISVMLHVRLLVVPLFKQQKLPSINTSLLEQAALGSKGQFPFLERAVSSVREVS